MKLAHPDCPNCQCYTPEEGERLTITVNDRPVAGNITLREGDKIKYQFVKTCSVEGQRCTRQVAPARRTGDLMNDPDITPPGDRIGELEDQLAEAWHINDAYRDALTVMQRERDDARAVAAEILPEYERATRFDRTPADEARLAEWRAGAGLETS